MIYRIRQWWNRSGNQRVVLALLAAIAVFTVTAAISRGINVHPLQGKTIIIDAGHGGFDPGTIGVSDVREDRINLAIAQYLQGLLEEAEATVVMTREDENGLYGTDTPKGQWKNTDMRERGKIIKGTEADAMVSVHMNSFKSNTSVHGAQVFYAKNSVEGEKLAQCVQERFRDSPVGYNKREIKVGDFYVIKVGSMPSILVECGFLSNRTEEQALLSEEYQREVAWNIYAGLMEYFALSQ